MKKWLIRGSLTLVALLILSIASGYFYIKGQGPDYDEVLDIPDIEADVDVYYDEYAIPHIYADNISDAYIALGYVHAKDRLWQMELLRRIAPGRLSEVFGSATLETDKFFKTMGLGHQSKLEAARFEREADEPLKGMVQGYVQGINHYMAHSSTIEHQLLGLDVEPYTIEDVYNVIGYMSFSFSIAHRTEPILDFINSDLGAEYLAALDVHVSPLTKVIESNGTDYSDLSSHLGSIIDGLPAPELIGSNSWVISPDKTKGGGVLFANDPHIGFSQPSVWYEAHINVPGFELYGYHIAGFPLAQIGHTRHHSIGLTMFENDDLDYYREQVNEANPEEYWAVDHWEKFEFRKEVINIKDQDPVEMEVRDTRHGPVISDVVDHLDNADPVSMWWVYQKIPLQLLKASYLIMNSSTLEGVREGASLIHSPGLNIMYGDVEGNVAWWAAAKLPKRPAHVNSKLILDGASGQDDITEYYDFADNPQAVNPEWGYVYSANNQSVTKDSIRHEGYYLPEDRARQITSLLDSKNNWTVDDVKLMLNDVQSQNAPEIVASIIRNMDQSGLNELEKEAVQYLHDWKGEYSTDEVAPTVYTKLVYQILKSMMQDELGDRWDTFNGTHVMKRSIQPMIANESTAWWDDTGTTTIESRSDIIEQALKVTIDQLENQLGSDMAGWQWGRVHTLEHPHAFDANASLRGYFNVGPYEVPGATEVINNLQFVTSEDGTYEVKAGPSTRRVIDMSDLENDSWSILPTGQSGNVLSPHYKDQADMFAAGQFRKQLMNKDEIVASQRYHTIIK